MHEIYETINILASGIQTLNDDTQRLSSDSVRLQSTIESITIDFGSLKLSIQEQSAFLDDIKPNQEILQQDVASLKQKVDDLQYVSYDGTLIWKINSFHEKMSKFNLNMSYYYQY
jgi:peptidoglycan hydrolase CwlO-like protein